MTSQRSNGSNASKANPISYLMIDKPGYQSKILDGAKRPVLASRSKNPYTQMQPVKTKPKTPKASSKSKVKD